MGSEHNSCSIICIPVREAVGEHSTSSSGCPTPLQQCRGGGAWEMMNGNRFLLGMADDPTPGLTSPPQLSLYN